MNERMYELINQCFIGTTDGKLSELNTVVNIEKFAELIVRECARVGVSAFERNRKHGLDDIIHAIRGDIVKHFGVEE